MDIINYLEFEKALENAFPLKNNHQFNWEKNGASIEASDHFGEKTWREMVGFEITCLDFCFSHNLELFPQDAIVYYLPAFLLSASLTLYGAKNCDTFPTQIVDGLLLASPDTLVIRNQVDNMLCPVGSVSQFPEGRVALYHALNPQQRKCVAMFLRLYWGDFWMVAGNATESKRQCFQEIVDIWEHSGLKCASE